jgi:hypothetical protein
MNLIDRNTFSDPPPERFGNRRFIDLERGISDEVSVNLFSLSFLYFIFKNAL